MLHLRKLLHRVGFWATSRRYRSRLKNKDFTILCSNCIGGILYHLLGMAFLSPTINLWMTQGDFITLCCDLPKYMEAPLTFVETERPYPVAKCADLTIYFNHYASAEEAARKWERRKKRIRYDNLYIILYYGDGVTAEMLQKLETVDCKNILVLCPDQPDIPHPWLKQFKPNGDSIPAMRGMNQDIWGIHRILRQVDFISFLNNGSSSA